MGVGERGGGWCGGVKIALVTKEIDILKMPRLVGVSLGLSILQALLQFRWKAIRYSNFGPRPFGAKLFLVVPGIVLMFVMGNGISSWQKSDEDSEKPVTLMDAPPVRPFAGALIWMVIAIIAWIVAVFVLG